jgi:hypothetical protein
MMKAACLLIIAFQLTGCISWTEAINGSKFPLMNAVVIYESRTTDGAAAKIGIRSLSDNAENLPGDAEVKGYITVWSPEFNGAFVGPDGKGCIQAASYVNSKSGEVGIPAKLFEKAASGEFTAEYLQKITPLMEVSRQQTFMSIGMYGICQLVAVGGADAGPSKRGCTAAN